MRRATRRYANALTNVAVAYMDLWEAHDYGDPNPGSPAKVEHEKLEDEFGEEYIDPGGSVITLTGVYLTTAVDHMRSTAALFTEKRAGVFSVWVTGRALLEVCGITYWLLEPTLDPEQRQARVFTDRLHSLAGAETFIERANIDVKDVENDPGTRIAGILEQSKTMTFETGRTGRGVWYVGEPRPSMTALVDDLAYPGTYSVFSGYSHGELWALAHQQIPADIADPTGKDRSFSRAAIGVEEYQALALYLLQGFVGAVRRFAEHLGWEETQPFAETAKRANADLAKLPQIQASK